MNQGLSPCEDVLGRQFLLGSHFYDDSWEIGRLVLAQQYRYGNETLRKALHLTLLHLVGSINISNGFALCSPVLSRLYRRFGFDVIVKNACQGATGCFSLIHGPVPRVLRVLSEADEAQRLSARARP